MMDESIQLDASEHVETSEYPRKTNITMENHIFFMGKSTLGMAIFNSYVNYQRVSVTILHVESSKPRQAMFKVNARTQT